MMKSRFRMTLLAVSLLFSTIWGVNSSVAQLPEWPECMTEGLTEGEIGSKYIEGQHYYVRRMATILDSALDDFGANGGSDDLEIFCVSRTSSDRYGKIAMCLSKESCPWR